MDWLERGVGMGMGWRGDEGGKCGGARVVQGGNWEAEGRGIKAGWKRGGKRGD